MITGTEGFINAWILFYQHFITDGSSILSAFYQRCSADFNCLPARQDRSFISSLVTLTKTRWTKFGTWVNHTGQRSHRHFMRNVIRNCGTISQMLAEIHGFTQGVHWLCSAKPLIYSPIDELCNGIRWKPFQAPLPLKKSWIREVHGPESKQTNMATPK